MYIKIVEKDRQEPNKTLKEHMYECNNYTWDEYNRQIFIYLPDDQSQVYDLSMIDRAYIMNDNGVTIDSY